MPRGILLCQDALLRLVCLSRRRKLVELIQPVIAAMPQVILAFKRCHTDHPFAKFFGACNKHKVALDKCLKVKMLVLMLKIALLLCNISNGDTGGEDSATAAKCCSVQPYQHAHRIIQECNA